MDLYDFKFYLIRWSIIIEIIKNKISVIELK